MMLAPHALIDQKHLPVPAEAKQQASYSAMVAANETLHLLNEFSSLKYGLNFENYDKIKDNYSVKIGFEMLAIDSGIYFIIGCFLESLTFIIAKIKKSKPLRESQQNIENISKVGLNVKGIRLSPN